MKPVGVLLLVSSLRFGGAEKHTIALANHLDPARFNVDVCWIKGESHLAAELDSQREIKASCLQARGKFDWSAIRRLAALIDERGIDIVACTNGYPLLYAFAAARLSTRKVRLVEVLHTTIVHGRKMRAALWLYRQLIRSCDLLVYVSHGQRAYWLARGMRARRDVVIQNGIDTNHFTDQSSAADKLALRARFGFAGDDYVIGLCAALRREKAHGDLLQGLIRLHRRGVPAKALLIGEGVERARIEQQVRELGLESCVAITGFQQDVRPFIAACDVMTLTSHRVETFSIAALESMSLGKPIVLTRIGGAEEQVIPGENGYLYEAGDIDALADRLHKLADRAGRERMGQRAALYVRERFTTEKMINAFNEELLRVAAHPADRGAAFAGNPDIKTVN